MIQFIIFAGLVGMAFVIANAVLFRRIPTAEEQAAREIARRLAADQRRARQRASERAGQAILNVLGFVGIVAFVIVMTAWSWLGSLFKIVWCINC